MAKPPDFHVDIDDFPGMIEAADDGDLPDGASSFQINIGSRIAGLLETRRGVRPMRFESISTFNT